MTSSVNTIKLFRGRWGRMVSFLRAASVKRDGVFTTEEFMRAANAKTVSSALGLYRNLVINIYGLNIRQVDRKRDRKLAIAQFRVSFATDALLHGNSNGSFSPVTVPSNTAILPPAYVLLPSSLERSYSCNLQMLYLRLGPVLHEEYF